MVTLDELCSPAYRAQLHAMAEKGAWSGGGVSYVKEIARLCHKSEARSVLDYGCGFVDLEKEFIKAKLSFDTPFRVQSFDPGVPGRDTLPEPADVVMCVDCLEHVEPDRVQNVINHIHSLTIKCALLVIATRPAEKRLPDGRNAHLTIDSVSWWTHQLLDNHRDWKAKLIDDEKAGMMHMWFRKLATTDTRTLV